VNKRRGQRLQSFEKVLNNSPLWWWLFPLLLIGAGLRVAGLDFGLPNDAKPDESPLIQVAINNLLSPIFLQGDWQLHPRFLGFPSLYFYLEALFFAVYYGIGHGFGWFPNWQSFLIASSLESGMLHLILRGFSVFIGTALIAAIALLAHEWREKRAIVLNAALLATVNYLWVRNSHFGSIDMLMTLGVTLSLWAILRDQRLKTQQSLQLACILCGLSIGTKYPAIILLLPLWTAIFESYVDDYIDWAGFFKAAWKPTALVFLVFLLTSPYVVLDFPLFLKDFSREARSFFQIKVPGVESGWLFYPGFALWHGVGGWALLLAALGIGARFRQPEADWRDYTLLSFLLGFYMLLGFNQRVLSQSALPLVPVILLYAVQGIVTCAAFIREKTKKNILASGSALLLLLLALVPQISLSIGFNQRLMQADTRSIARNWILTHVPRQTPIATGPQLGQLSLPAEYGQLLVQTGPEHQAPPLKADLLPLSQQTLLTNTYADPDLLKKLGIRYVVTYQGIPAYGNRPWEFAMLSSNAKLVYYISPLKPDIDPARIGRFDPLDAFYLPYAAFEAFERPGPVIAIFDLAQPPAEPHKSIPSAPDGKAPQAR
jgi:hypothetical protein